MRLLLSRLRVFRFLPLLGVLLPSRVFAEPLPTPLFLGISGSCPEAMARWTAVPAASYYEVMVWSGGNLLMYLIALEPGSDVSALEPGGYSLQVRAASAGGSFSSSEWSARAAFTIRPCGACAPPRLTMSSADPGLLWPPNGRRIPVTFSGSVASECPLSGATYRLLDSQGSGLTGTLAVAPDGRFTLQLPLEASRRGSDPAGRRYELTVEAANEAGTARGAPLTVIVPHDQGR